MTTLLDGRATARAVNAETAALVASLRDGGADPTLALVVATGDASSAWYVRALIAAAAKVGLTTRHLGLGAEAPQRRIEATLRDLADDPGVHGVMLQTPLPPGVSLIALTSLIPPDKDVDGINPLSAGRLAAGLAAFAPATAAAVMRLLDAYAVPLEGAHAVVVGRSLIVGKPLAQLLLARNATVTVCHSRTRSLAEITRQADVLVAALGRPRFITGEHVSPSCTVVDVGTTPDDNGMLVGDVDAEAVGAEVKALSPVPGGVGPVTTALLLRQSALAAALAGKAAAVRR
jgi:methylenetetrahydrofolate dehydrogenase (NADP+)/methenyltetrahydrofolate cyclohydrolase